MYELQISVLCFIELWASGFKDEPTVFTSCFGCEPAEWQKGRHTECGWSGKDCGKAIPSRKQRRSLSHLRAGFLWSSSGQGETWVQKGRDLQRKQGEVGVDISDGQGKVRGPDGRRQVPLSPRKEFVFHHPLPPGLSRDSTVGFILTPSLATSWMLEWR